MPYFYEPCGGIESLSFCFFLPQDFFWLGSIRAAVFLKTCFCIAHRSTCDRRPIDWLSCLFHGSGHDGWRKKMTLAGKGKKKENRTFTAWISVGPRGRYSFFTFLFVWQLIGPSGRVLSAPPSLSVLMFSSINHRQAPRVRHALWASARLT